MDKTSLTDRLDALLQDDDLTDEKLREAAEGLLPAISDYLHDKGPSADGVSLIAAERKRQIEVKKWTPEHDDTHERGELAEAAACYALPPVDRNIYAGVGGHSNMIRTLWPWTFDQWKPATGEPYAWVLTDGRIEELVKAGALIVAEIERLQRVKEREGQK